MSNLMKHTNHSYCHINKTENVTHNGHGNYGGSTFKTAIHATVHCLTGCVIGEMIGLMVGVTLGLHPYVSMGLSIILAFISGFSLTVFPLMKRTHISFNNATKAVWLGELLSIGVMEIVMNSIDYHMGGVCSDSIFNSTFWEALALAIPASYIAVLPVNYWLINKQIKRCH